MIVNDSFLYVCEYGEINELNKMSVLKMETNKENTQPFRVCF